MKANRNLKQNDEAVSPVIGVILMVAITVILAAVIGAFVFGMGPPEAAPQASLRAAGFTTAGAFTIEHQGGDEITLYNGTALDPSTRLLVDGLVLIPGDAITSTSINDGKFTVGEQINVAIGLGLSSGQKVVLIDVISQKPIATFTVRT